MIDLTDAQAAQLMHDIKVHASISEADNRKLLWLAIQLPFWNTAAFGTDAAILSEIENRLYPEYDGENVKLQEWGWSTPDGDIAYLPKKGPSK